MTDNTAMDELRHRLALWRLPGIGAVSFAGLLARYGCARTALAQPIRDWDRRTGGRLPERPRLDWAGVDRDMAWLQASPQHAILTLEDARYPELLRSLAAAPPLLFVRGDAELLHWPQLALVGSRRPSAGGRDSAARFSARLAAAGLVITSGLAKGIDAVAHSAAIDSHGATLAVTGTGPDRHYPPETRALAERIIDRGGAIVTEFPSGTGPRRQHFPRRNRLISGLSLGTLVIEAGIRSGSLITAAQALEQGREVFALPGSIHHPLARGCHALIKTGRARLVETVEDILEDLALPVSGFVAGRSSPESGDAADAVD